MNVLMPMSCVHLGAKQHDPRAFAAARYTARRVGAQIVLLGDVIDNGVYVGTKVPNVVYEQTMDPDAQIDEAVRVFRQLDVVRVIGGNHCERTKKAAGVHPEKVIADRLGVPFTEDVWQTRIDGLNCVFTHGTGVNDFSKILRAYDNVDVVVSGHTHQLSYVPIQRVRAFGGGVRTIHQVRAGSFFKYGGYAKRALVTPGPVGCPVLTFAAGSLRVRIDV